LLVFSLILEGTGGLKIENLYGQNFSLYNRVQSFPLCLLSNGSMAHIKTASSQKRAKRTTHLHLVALLEVPYTGILSLYVFEMLDNLLQCPKSVMINQ